MISEVQRPVYERAEGSRGVNVDSVFSWDDDRTFARSVGALSLSLVSPLHTRCAQVDCVSRYSVEALAPHPGDQCRGE